jgi:hypothetical protein
VAQHVVFVENGTFAKACFRMVSNLLVRIQLGRVGRQEGEPDVPVLLIEKTLGFLAMVIAVSYRWSQVRRSGS